MVECEEHHKPLLFDNEKEIWIHEDGTPCEVMNTLNVMRGYLRKPFTELELFDLGNYEYTQSYVERELDRAIQYILSESNIDTVIKNVELIEFMGYEFIDDPLHRFEQYNKLMKKFLDDFTTKILIYYLYKLSKEPIIKPFLINYEEPLDLLKVATILKPILYDFGETEGYFDNIHSSRLLMLKELKSNKIFISRQDEVNKINYDLLFTVLSYMNENFSDKLPDIISDFKSIEEFDKEYKYLLNETRRYYKQTIFIADHSDFNLKNAIKSVVLYRLANTTDFIEKLILVRVYIVLYKQKLSEIYDSISIPYEIKYIIRTMQDELRRSIFQILGMFRSVAKKLRNFYDAG